MFDDIVVSGGGSIAVAPEELFADARSLHALAREASSLRARLIAVDTSITTTDLEAVDAAVSSQQAERDIDQGVIVLQQLEWEARGIGWALDTTADGYGFVELVIGGMFQGVADGVGAAAGRFPIGMLLPALASVGAVGGGVMLGSRLLGTRREGQHGVTGTPIGVQANRMLTDPMIVSAIRQATQAAPTTMASGLGLPPMLGEAIGPAGVATVATVLMRLGGPAGMFTETGVRVVSTRALPTDDPPTGFAGRLDRIPAPDADGVQIVIDRWQVDGGPDEFDVYIAGTETFSPYATTEPFDMTSNMGNAAGGDSAACESVRAALVAAGADGESPVTFTGYSQGGATAARLAASGDFDCRGVLSFGGPTGQIPIPSEIPAVLVEHDDDLVPALGGRQDNRQAVLITREVFAERQIPSDLAVPAHHLEYYQETAAMMDAATSEQIAGAARQLEELHRGATLVSSTGYHVERVSESAVPPRSDAR